MDYLEIASIRCMKKNIFGLLEKVRALSESAKTFLAGMITVVIVAALVMASMSVSNLISTKNNLNILSPSLNQESSSSQYFEPALSLFNLSYVFIQYTDLPIYPEEFTKKYFTDEELSKPQLTGPEVDADGDGLLNRQEFLFNTNPKKANTFCSLQPENTTCETKTDGDRVASGKHPKNNADLPDNLQFLLEKKYTENIGSLRETIQYGLSIGSDFPSIYADGLMEKSDTWYKEFEQNMVVLDKTYKPLIEEENNLLNERELQFYVEIMNASKTDSLSDLTGKYQKRLAAIEETKAEDFQQKIQTVNIGIYSTAKQITQALVELKKQPTDAQLQANVKKLFQKLIKMEADFSTEYNALKQANKL